LVQEVGFETFHSSRGKLYEAMSREKLLQISALQQFNGSFQLNSNLGNCLGVNLSSLEQAARSNRWDSSAFATVVALVYFQKKMDSLKDDWELIADKSKIWLLKNFRDEADSMYETAMNLVV